jgi:hypothetical protein
MKHLALDEIQITPATEPAPASSSEVFAFIAREGRKLQVNLLVGAEDSRSTPRARRAR